MKGKVIQVTEMVPKASKIFGVVIVHTEEKGVKAFIVPNEIWTKVEIKKGMEMSFDYVHETCYKITKVKWQVVDKEIKD